MSTSIGVHLHAEDEWSITNCMDNSDPFVSIDVHGVTTIFLRPDNINALLTIVMETKDILERSKN